MTLVLDAGNELHSAAMLNRLLNCIHKVMHRCVTLDLSAWSYINFTEILPLTKVHLALSEPKAQSRKWEELFLPLDRVGDIALYLLPGRLPDAYVSAKGVLLLSPSNAPEQGLPANSNFPLSTEKCHFCTGQNLLIIYDKLFITFFKYCFIYLTDINTARNKSVKCKPVTLHAVCVSTFKNIYPQFSVHYSF